MTGTSYISLQASAARHEDLVRDAEAARLAAHAPRKRRLAGFTIRVPALRRRRALRGRLELET